MPGSNSVVRHCFDYRFGQKKARRPCGSGLCPTFREGIKTGQIHYMSLYRIPWAVLQIVTPPPHFRMHPNFPKKIAIQEMIPETQSYLESGLDV
ncbi:MAG: hypothetical protein JWP38_3168 [Herbaspirillum sp.]|nr:hypothetical protein [Herbaspirillum sp.]